MLPAALLPPAEGDVKAAFQQWHAETYDVDAPGVFQSVIGTRTIVEWPNCVLVDAFDLGKWMTLTMQNKQFRPRALIGLASGHD